MWPFSRRKESQTTGATLALHAGRPAWMTRSLDDFAKHGYQANPDVYSVINQFAKAASGVEWGVQRFANGEWVDVPDHPALKLIQNPNPRQSNTGWVREAVSWRLLTGNRYIELVGPKNGPPRELYLLRPSRMSIVPGSAAHPILRYEYKVGANVTPLDPELIVHSKFFHPTDDFYGLSPLEAAAKLVDQAAAAMDWNLSMLQNGGIPPGFLKIEDANEKQLEQLRKDLRENWSGPDNAGRPGLLTGGMEYQDAARSPQEMEFLALQKMCAVKFALVIGWPPELIDADKKFTNYEQARKAAYLEAVLPELDDLADELNRGVMPAFGEHLRFYYKRDDIEALAEDRDKLWERAKGAIFATLDEQRDVVGLDPLPHGAGEVILVPATMVQLGVAQAGGAQEKRKALNISSDEQKQSFWEQTNATWERLHSGMLAIVTAAFNTEKRRVTEAIRSADGPILAGVKADQAVLDNQPAWMDALKSIYLSVGEVFAPQTLDQLKTQAGPARSKDIEDDAWRQYVLEYLQGASAKKVRHITDTTRKQIRDTLAEGVAANESIDVLAKRVDQLYLDDIVPNRAEMIARTETVPASNLASQSAAKSTGLPLRKGWLAARDARTRDAHAGADGQQVTLNDTFTVAGEALSFPGDSSHGASAGNIIHCRCTQTYEVDE